MKLLTLNAEPENNEINYSVDYEEETEKQFVDEDRKEFVTDKIVEAFIKGMSLNDKSIDVPDAPILKIEVGEGILDGRFPLLIEEGDPIIGFKHVISKPRQEKLIANFAEELLDAVLNYLDAVAEEVKLSGYEVKGEK